MKDSDAINFEHMWLATHRRNAAIVLETDSKRTANSASTCAHCVKRWVPRLHGWLLRAAALVYHDARPNNSPSDLHNEQVLATIIHALASAIGTRSCPPLPHHLRGESARSKRSWDMRWTATCNRCEWPTRFQLGEYVYFDEICCFMISFECYWACSIAPELSGVDFKPKIGLFSY